MKTIKLLEHSFAGKETLEQLLENRHSCKEFSSKELTLQQLSNALWAANGLNRTNEGRRTAPSAMNRQDTDIYVILKEGIYFFDPFKNELQPVIEGDYSKLTGQQEYVWATMANFIYVSKGKRREEDIEAWRLYIGMNVGHSSQNVYLYAQSEGLGSVIRGYVDREELKKILKLDESDFVVAGQTIGYPR
ncbi:SagB-type dehydrogenase family enzyme [Dysgonomonas sp. PH5-45]|uniref:nitroreductase family protein n=1 Tax=unclassified Dysgonomonas TaxID=2630389 RepID=UPI002474EC55|nr:MULTISPECIES: SagB/ThcOx family dehydrogenase [unclassified Dysgonomonas]MDH6354951.1 SagB-type dehydrogenase family enzyme [Dysgonomonas sp. PH5-45]MDH6387850.1 SagB-type dehydrogenase family enzyme [Dysgonomonas sp. PH5-37]